jgi:hypothetical protein
MTLLTSIAILWVAFGLACWAVLWFQNRRPLTDTDRLCSRIDAALSQQYGARPTWFR